MDLIKMQMLGGFSVSVGDKVICSPDSRRGQMWSLLQYLITFRNREIPAVELQSALWPNGTGSPSNALKNLVYRVRTEFENAGISDAKRLIICKRGIYRFNGQLAMEADTEKFAAAVEAAKGLTGEEHTKALQAIVAMYTGDYLPGEKRQPWTNSVRRDLHAKYVACAQPLMQYYDGDSKWSDLFSLASHSTTIDPFDEDASYFQLRAMLGLGLQSRALEYYNNLQNLYYKERCENIPEKVRGLYRDIIRHMNNIEIDIAKIKQDISEKGETRGAFLCEYEIFKEMYRVEARSASRTGQKIFLSLFTLTDGKGNPPIGRVRNRAMNHLEKTLVLSLRKADILSQFSATQYVAMMSTRTYENGMKVIKRIERRFKTEYRGYGIVLSTTLQPIDTKE